MTEYAHVEVRAGAYADSVTLLQISRALGNEPGVLAAQVAMATPLNLDVLAGMGFEIPSAGPNDMVVALRLSSTEDVDPTLRTLESSLKSTSAATRTEGDRPQQRPRTTRTALSRSDSELALVSVPGQYAFSEAMDALDAGRDVMLFSDNVPIEQEVTLKRAAAERGLLVMGPDCGTAVLGGVGLGFANTVQSGPLGLVAASGTGCQQLMCLFDAAGVGVSSALGVGGRDLREQVAGLSTRTALARLDADPAIEHIVVVSKPPPTDEAATALEAYASTLATPVEFALLGTGRPDLTEAAEHTLKTLGAGQPTWPSWGTRATPKRHGLLRGLFVGGTLASETAGIAGTALGEVRTDLSGLSSPQHAVVDFGDDTLTQGRAHPMIDPTLRLEQLAAVADDPETAVILLDVVLGHGAESDPAAQLAPAIARIRDIPVLVSCVGTESDPQRLSDQARALASAGAEVHLSNAAAARRAVQLAGAAG